MNKEILIKGLKSKKINYYDIPSELENDNEIIEEGVTKDILSSSKKIMKSFDYARNNRSFAHTNDIMKQNEAEFLCLYIIDLYKFLSKINLEKDSSIE